MNDQEPLPMTPPGCDLRDFPHTPLFRARLFGSSFHARANDSEWRAGVTLWLKSWDQVPAGSLPDDDIELCRLAELARDIKTWKKHKAGALHGWVRCSDGRLYHPVVAEGVNNAIEKKAAQRAKTAKARLAALERRSKDGIGGVCGSLDTEAERRSVAQQSRPPTAAGTDDVKGSVTERVTDDLAPSVTDAVTGSKRREGEGKEKEKGSSVGAAAAASPRGSRLPADWALPASWGEWALSEFPSWNADFVRSEAAKFADFWHSKSGKDATKVDWNATWRNWCRNARAPSTRLAIARPQVDLATKNSEAKRLLGFDDEDGVVNG